MASIQTMIQLTDRVTAPLMNITSALDSVINEFERAQSASGSAFDMEELSGARAKIAMADQQIQEIVADTNKIPSAAAKAESGFKGWQKAIIVANQGLNLVKNTIGRLGLTDMSGAFGRMDTMNRFDKTVSIMTGSQEMAQAGLAELKDTTLGTAYGLDVASKSAQNFLTRGMALGNATDQVRIWADAVSFYGEGTNEQLESVVDAIGKMYSKGKVEADQLDRLFDAGIGAAEIYAQATGTAVSKVKDDLSSGAIGAAQFIDVVSQSLDKGVSSGAAKDAGGTWATTFANMQAAVTRGWTNVISSLDEALAARGLPSSMEMVTQFGTKVEQVLTGIGSAMGYVVDGAITVYNVMSSVAGFIVDNWSIISPIIWGVVIALGAYTTALGIFNIAKGISNALEKTSTFITGVRVAALEMEEGATFAATVAQYGFNAALLACPLTWIILAIIAVIAVIYAVVAAINKAENKTISATGVIFGVVAWLGAAILNIVIGVINGIIQMAWSYFVEPFIGIIEWVLNVANGGFDSFGGAVANLIGQIISWFLSLGKIVTKIIDAIFGTDWTAGLTSLQDSVTSWGKNDNAITLSREAPQIGRIAYEDAYNAGYGAGESLANKVSGMFDFGKDKNKDSKDPYKRAELQNPALTSAANQTASNTAEISDKLDATSNQLKYIREYAEREAINRFTTASINVNMTNNNNMSSDADVDGIMNTLKNGIQQQMNIVAEGV